MKMLRVQRDGIRVPWGQEESRGTPKDGRNVMEGPWE